MAIKKAYAEIVSVLEANKGKKVSEVLDQVIALASAKTDRASGGTSFLKDSKGQVVAVLDYYFKRWMPLVGDKAVDFGAKKNTATGVNSMCKAGVSEWTKQQRVAKQAGADLLKKVASGEIKPSDIAKEQEAIEAARKAIVPTELGFATRDDLVKYLKANKVELAA